jgi:predicted AlkP superfamily pyrophosphatase or phosphodiesterase
MRPPHASNRCANAWRLASIASLTLGLAACHPPPQGPTDSSRLVLVVSVDQMRYDYLERFRPLFHGGLEQILDQGAVFTEARYRHAATETAPGHSVILSGRSPRYTGIVGNDWYDTLRHGMLNAVDDPVQRSMGGRGRAASPANFLGYTLGDRLKKLRPASRVVGVAGKDRGAILMAGRRADLAAWYSSADGHFVTSSYYVHEVPAWLVSLNARRLPDSYRGRPWTRLLPDVKLYEKYAGPDAVEGESDRKDTTFPHVVQDAPPSSAFYGALSSTPYADEVVLQAALAAMDGYELGRRGATDLLAVGFSATDYIGHKYGPDSQEVMDQILRLDRVLGTLLTEVQRRVGRGQVVLVLTADHGVMPLVEVLQARGIAAKRIDPETLQSVVEEAFAKRFPGAPPLIAQYDSPSFYLDLEAIDAARLSRSDVEETARKALLATGLVEAVYTQAQLLGPPPADDPAFALFRNAFFQPRSPHLTVRMRPNIYFGDHPGGTGHGTVEDCNRHVPIVLWGQGIRPSTSAAPCGPEDIAPTLGKLLGVDYPPEPGARVLEELWAR